MNALDALYSKNTKQNNIAERRKKLSELLLNEQKEFEVGLRNHCKIVFRCFFIHFIIYHYILCGLD